jgi:hypothetical protein
VRTLHVPIDFKLNGPNLSKTALTWRRVLRVRLTTYLRIRKSASDIDWLINSLENASSIRFRCQKHWLLHAQGSHPLPPQLLHRHPAMHATTAMNDTQRPMAIAFVAQNSSSNAPMHRLMSGSSGLCVWARWYSLRALANFWVDEYWCPHSIAIGTLLGCFTRSMKSHFRWGR